MEKEKGTAKRNIGEKLDGGIVFYVDSSGEHGLMASPVDQTADIRWSNGTNMATLAIKNGIGQGSYNTEKIILSQGIGDYAAIFCAKYSLEGNGDWYLPSIYELDLMYRNIGNGAKGANRNIGGFANKYYWSSSEQGSSEAFVCPFNSGGQVALFKGSGNICVRAARIF